MKHKRQRLDIDRQRERGYFKIMQQKDRRRSFQESPRGGNRLLMLHFLLFNLLLTLPVPSGDTWPSHLRLLWRNMFFFITFIKKPLPHHRLTAPLLRLLCLFTPLHNAGINFLKPICAPRQRAGRRTFVLGSFPFTLA